MRIKLAPAADGIPAVALTAYRRGAHLANALQPGCSIPWQLVAAIGYIESDDGRIGGDVTNARGDEAFPIEGIPLDGSGGVARIVDGHGHFDRAEGPLQFIAGTWARWRTDGNGDGRADPQNIFDASASAARYLCSSGQNLSGSSAQPAAITLYNNSPVYVKNVMNVEAAYVAGRSAATVTLIPMPTACPPVDPKAAPAGQPAAQPAVQVATPASQTNPTTPAAPKTGAPGCPPVPTQKPAKSKKPAAIRAVAARKKSPVSTPPVTHTPSTAPPTPPTPRTPPPPTKTPPVTPPVTPPPVTPPPVPTPTPSASSPTPAASPTSTPATSGSSAASTAVTPAP